MSDAPDSFGGSFSGGSDPFGLGSLSGGQVAGIVQTADTAGIAPQQASSDPSSPLGALSGDLSQLLGALKQGNQVKGQATDVLGQFEDLIGIGKPPPAPVDNSQTILTVVAVVAFLILGGAVVWKLAHRGG